MRQAGWCRRTAGREKTSRRKSSILGRRRLRVERLEDRQLLSVAAGQIDMSRDAALTGAASDFGWAVNVGGFGSDTGRAIARDAAGNVYVTGSFQSLVEFDPGPDTCNLVSAGKQDVFVAKYTSAGALTWARSLRGLGDDSGNGIAVAADGSVYVTGSFQGTVDFDPGIGIYNLTSTGFSAIFVSKLDASGNFVWARGMSGTGYGSGNSIVLSADGSVYTTGYFQDTIDFDPGPDTYNLTSAGQSAFIAELDSAGTFVWARSLGADGMCHGNGIAVATDGSVYSTGYFSGTADFDPGPGTSILHTYQQEAYVSKLDASGNFVWATDLGNAAYFAFGTGIAVAADGSVYTTGSFRGTADFDPGVDTYEIKCNDPNGNDAFVWKLDAAGSLVWARVLGGADADYGESIAVALDGSVYTTGYFCGPADYDPGPDVYLLTGPGNFDVFVSILDASGNFLGARALGGPQYDYGYGVAVAPDGSICTTGSFESTADFNPGTGVYALTSAGGDDVFISWIAPPQAPTAIAILDGRVLEGQPVGTAVGLLQVTDADAGDPYTVTLVDGPGSLDNAAFTVSGNVLRTAAVFDAQVKNAYSIRLRVTDYLGLSHEQALTVQVIEAANACSVGDRVWQDVNANGIQDPGESGVSGVAVELFSSADATIGNGDDVSRGYVITDASGHYTFRSLLDGLSYYEVFRAPIGYSFAIQTAGSDRALDSDANASGVTRLFTLAASQGDTSHDVGLVGTAPSFGWAMNLGVSSEAVTTDSAGNVYVTGFSSGSLDFDLGPGIYNLTSVNQYDTYVAKYTSAGALVWARDLGGLGYGYGYGVAVSTDGSVYVTGDFQGTVDFDPSLSTYNLTSVGGFDAFVLKLDALGNFVWARSMGGTGEDQCSGIVVAADGSAYTTGHFQGTVDFDPGLAVFNLTSIGDRDIFIWKLDASGNLVWARAQGGAGNDWSNGIAIATDGSVYTTGMFWGTADFDPGIGNFPLTSGGTIEAFVSKLDASGNFVWARNIGGTNDSKGEDIAVGADGSVYITGTFEGTAKFGSGIGTISLASAGWGDVYISKLDSSGDFIWARRIGGNSDDYGSGIAVASDGSVYTTGAFEGTVDFEPGPGEFPFTTDNTYTPDAFVLRLDDSGKFVWARRLGGANSGSDFGYAVAVASDGSVYVTGRFQGTADFDPTGGVYNLTSTDSRDGYFWRLAPPQAPTAIALSSNRVAEGQPVGTVVGFLQITDADAGDVFALALIDGPGGSDNSSFTLDGNILRTATVFSFGAENVYSIRLRATDHAGLACERVLSVEVIAGTHPCSVGNLVWQDINANGIQDAGEPGMTGVAVEVYSSTDSVIGNTDDVSCGQAITDASGHYAFPSLANGLSYYAVFRTPVGYTFTTQAAGSDRAVDSDPNASGVTGLFTVAAGQTDTSHDAGLVGAAPGFGWAVNISGVASSSGHAITCDSAGNIYVTGAFTQAADFDPGPGIYNLANSDQHYSFVAKYTSAGALIWARSLGPCDYDYGYAGGSGIAVAGDGSVYTIGLFGGTVDFDPGPEVYGLTSTGDGSLFVLKLDALGNFAWARRAKGTGFVQGSGIVVTSSGSVCITGSFNGMTDFDASSENLPLTSAGGNDIFVWTLDTSGNLVWVQALGGTGDDQGNSIAVATDSSICITGQFSRTIDFDAGPSVCNLTSAGDTDVFVAKLDEATGNLLWACSAGGIVTERGKGIVVAADGSIYIAGTFSMDVDFDPGPGVCNLHSPYAYDPFVWKLDASGNFVWVREASGNGYSEVAGIALSGDGSVYTTGRFAGRCDFDPGPDSSLVVSTGEGDIGDIFVWRLDGTGSFGSAQRLGGTDDDTSYGIAIGTDGFVNTTGYFSGTADFDPSAGTCNLNGGAGAHGFVSRLQPAQAPTNLAISDNRIFEGQPIGTPVGIVEVSDGDVNESFTISLVAGIGDTDNTSFIVSDNVLRSAAVFDSQAKNAYSIRLRVTDHAGLSCEQTFAIQVVAMVDSSRIGSLAWRDLNANGMRDAGEPGLTGVVVEVFSSVDATIGNADDLLCGQAITDASGHYAFPVLPDGLSYYEVFHAPVGYTFTTQAAGSDRAVDSDPNISGMTALFAVTAGQAGTGHDAGFVGDAPGFGWAFNVGGSDWASGRAIAHDSTGSVYVTGDFSGTVDFDPGPKSCSLVSTASSDGFVAKYSSAGALVWVRQLGGKYSDQGTAIAVADDGSVYTTGYFQGVVDFESGPGVHNLTSAGGLDVFVLKLDTSGNFVWARSFGGRDQDSATGIAVAPDGSVYATGYFTGQASFDSASGNSSLTGVGVSDVFVWKLDASGGCIWAESLGGTSDDYSSGIAVTADGSAYITGNFSGSIDCDPGFGTHSLTSKGNSDIFVSKLDASGNFVSARSLGGTDDDWGNGVAVAADGSVYLTGDFHGAVDFDPGPATWNLTAAGGYDIFILKLDATDNFAWARSLGGVQDDFGKGIVATADGSVYMTGAFWDSPLANVGSGDVFVSKFDTSGNFVWAMGLGADTETSSFDCGVAVTTDGSVYATGSFFGAGDFDPGTDIYSLTGTGYRNVFVAKLNANQPPEGLVLSDANVAENRPAGTVVGSLSSVDANLPSESFTYTLVPGTGSGDNASFRIVGNQLQAAASFDYETRNAYSVRIRSTDQSGLWFEKPFTVVITDADDVPPIARLLSAPNVTIASGASYTFTIEYAGNTSIAASSLDNSDILVTGPNGFSQLAVLVSVDRTVDGTPRTASYRITPPGGAWSAANNGTYTLAIQPGQVTDPAGNAVGAGTLGTFWVDTVPPTASLRAQNIAIGGGSAYTFTVTFSDRMAIRTSTLDSSDFVVTGPKLFRAAAKLDHLDLAADGTPRTATYRITPPGGMWTPTANGVYTVLIVAGQVTDTAGHPVAAGRLGTFTVNALPDRIAPRATLAASPVKTTGGKSYTFMVTYADNVEIKAATLNSLDIQVTGPRNYRQLARLVSVNPGGNGTPRKATYSITPPAGAWSAANNGTYTISLQPGQITDTSGNAVLSGKLGTFVVDTLGPKATLTAQNITTSGLAGYSFTVTYADTTAINVATLDKYDLRVIGPNGYDRPASFVGVNAAAGVTQRTAIYRITPPAATWTSAANGTYTVVVQPGQVLDSLGNAMTKGPLGTFKVAIPGTKSVASAVPARPTTAASNIDHVFGLLGSSPGIDSAAIWASWTADLKRSKVLAAG